MLLVIEVGKQKATVITFNMFQLKIHMLSLFQNLFTPKNCFSVGLSVNLLVSCLFMSLQPLHLGLKHFEIAFFN